MGPKKDDGLNERRGGLNIEHRTMYEIKPPKKLLRWSAKGAKECKKKLTSGIWRQKMPLKKASQFMTSQCSKTDPQMVLSRRKMLSKTTKT